MSSIAQYKDLIKRKEYIIQQLRHKLVSRDREIIHLNQRINEVKADMKKLITNRWNKKWWQFWK